MIKFILSLLALITTDGLTMASKVLQFTSVEQGSNSHLTTATTQSCRTHDELNSLWQSHHGNADPVLSALDTNDFDSNMVVFVSLGDKPTGGYGIEVESVTEDESEIVLTCLTSNPSPFDMLTMAITQPYEILTVPKSDKPVRSVFKEAPPPPRPFPMFMLTFDEGADLGKIAKQMKELDAVLDVNLMESIKVAIVKCDKEQVSETEAMALLQVIDGVATVEMDPPPPQQGGMGGGGMGGGDMGGAEISDINF